MAGYESSDLNAPDNLTPYPAAGAEDAADDFVREHESMGISLPEQPRSTPAARSKVGGGGCYRLVSQ